MFAETKQERSQTLLPNLLNTFVIEDLVSQLGATGISIETVGVTVISNRAPFLTLGVGLFQLGFSVICGDQHSTHRWKKKKKTYNKAITWKLWSQDGSEAEKCCPNLTITYLN